MQVAYFADVLYQGLAAGSARYTAELAQALRKLPGLELCPLTLYPPETMQERAQARGYVGAQSVSSPVPRQIQYLLWHLTGFAGSVEKAVQGADVLHTPILIVPPCKTIPLVVTIHDLTFMLYPEHHNRKTRLVAQSGLHRAVQDAALFLAVSEHTKRDLIRLGGVSPNRIRVTPEAADPRFVPCQDTGTLSRLGIDAPYILYVGTLEPRKNITLLLRAFAALPDQAALKDTLLVLAGAKGWMYEEIFSLIHEMGLENRVRTLGYVSDADLPVLYTQAQVFAYPSLFEGFGLPVLEAMQCGAPVITTNVSSLPEVAGDAAILISPKDVAGLNSSLVRLLTEPALREEMRGKSLERAKQFSWQKTAELTAEAYHEAARGRS